MSFRVKLRRYLSSWRRARDGVTAIEFALIAPIAIGMTMMFLLLGLYEIQSAGLSYATQKAARQLLVGNVANGASPVNITNFVNNYLCPALPPPMSCERLVVNAEVMTDTNSWLAQLNANRTGLASSPMDNSKTKFCIGGGSAVVALKVYYAMPTWGFPLLDAPSTQFKGSSAIWIVSTAAFKNEPFATSYNGC